MRNLKIIINLGPWGGADIVMVPPGLKMSNLYTVVVLIKHVHCPLLPAN